MQKIYPLPQTPHILVIYSLFMWLFFIMDPWVIVALHASYSGKVEEIKMDKMFYYFTLFFKTNQYPSLQEVYLVMNHI